MGILKRQLNIKILVLSIIICGGTYILTKSLSITAGVAILLFVINTLLDQWVDKKEKQYFHKDQDNGETD